VNRIPFKTSHILGEILGKRKFRGEFMMKNSRIWILCILAMLLPSLLFGQSTNATITGQVGDPTKAVIPQAKVTAINNETNIHYEGMTSAVGAFVITSLPPGNYRIQVEKTGFKTIIKPDVALHVQDAIELNFEMALGSQSETVTVEAGAPLLNTESGAVSTVVDRQFVENMPLNGRSFQNLIALSPGVVMTPTNGFGAFSVNGQRVESNYFMVDGVGANTGSDAFVNSIGIMPGQTANGGYNSMVSVDALQEFRIDTSSYAAEFGRAPGGQIQMSTRSGTNEFHGDVFEYLRNDKLDAADYFVDFNHLRKPPERMNDFGGVIGGPIVIPKLYDGKDKTFFFFSYEGLRLSQPGTTQLAVPSLATRQSAGAAVQVYMNAFPQPNGPEFTSAKGAPLGFAPFNASYSNSAGFSSTSLRVDHHAGQKLVFFGRYSYAPSQTNRRDTATDTIFDDANNFSFTGGLTYTINSRMVNDLRVNYSSEYMDERYIEDPLGISSRLDNSLLCPPIMSTSSNLCRVLFNYNGYTSMWGAGPEIWNKQKQFNLVDSFQWAHGTHVVKLGGDFRRLFPLNNHTNWFYSVFQSASDVQNGIATLANIYRYTQDSEPVIKQTSLYAQDTWRATPRLTVTYGLRWEYMPALTYANEHKPAVVSGTPAALTPQPVGTPFYNVGPGEFWPRLGIAYRIHESSNASTVLRGGFGVFSDSANTAMAYASTYQQYPLFIIGPNPSLQYPLAQANLSLPSLPTSADPPFLSSQRFNGFLSGFKLPYTIQQNVALEQSLGRAQSLSLTYIGSTGRRLLNLLFLSPTSGTYVTQTLQFFENLASSSYNALQVEFKRQLSHGLQALVSYSWAHAIDNTSQFSNYYYGATLLRGNSDFDIRHTLSGAFSYTLPAPEQGFARSLLSGWSLDSLIFVRSANPVNVYLGTQVLPDGTTVFIQANSISGVPLYLYGSKYPGGKAINPAAFTRTPSGTESNFGKNVLRGFGLTQIDLSARRDFHLYERLHLQARMDAFNVFNHPNFWLGGNVNVTSVAMATTTFAGSSGSRSLSPLFAEGGARSLQVSLKLVF
jgi:hypothetical protein